MRVGSVPTVVLLLLALCGCYPSMHKYYRASVPASHLWLLLGSGSWFEDESRGCWVVLDSWTNSDDLIARVQSYTDSPFRTEHIFGERFLSRDEVLGKEGALAWIIQRRDELLELHDATRQFLLDANVKHDG